MACGDPDRLRLEGSACRDGGLPASSDVGWDDSGSVRMFLEMTAKEK